MNSIIENELLHFHPDTVQKIRKMYNLERPGEMDEAITVLEEWLKNQHHFTRKIYPRTFLERSIILQKGSLERTKAQINNICAMRTLLPQFFVKDDKIPEILNDMPVQAAFLPKLTEDNYRVVVIKMLKKDPNEQYLLILYKLSIQLSEYLRKYDYCCGVIIVVDYRDVNIMDYVAAANITHLYHAIKILMVGHALRIKGLHIISPSKAVNTFLNMVKTFFNTKVASRMYLQPNIEKLHESVPSDILPEELGGYDGSLASLSVKWRDLLTSEKMVNYFEELSHAKSTEAHKFKEAINDPDLGVSGSFRSLNVD